MTPAEFRAWRKRMDLTRSALLDTIHHLGWPSLTIRTLDTWQRRGPPEHAAVILKLLELLRCR